ncbi:hypothetical protein O181_033443 [Austropuccinia psidii MF-1]|uniref:Uncharacterized protein n=1 Tax=Austropuccinia psidii MF-1 TaxID=1389203 RepID=A0A9Q3D1I4_9BASI|nr:hypothetical protein [Austropuccinia psidii MF-1]
MAGDELYASSPLVHKENFTRHLDDEDEEFSPTQSETNGEPRRDNFMAHEEGTWSNSEFTHHQMPLAQSMLNHSKMKKKRKHTFKAHNVAKHAIQKQQQRCLKAEIPDNIHGMRSDVNTHCQFLLKRKDKDFS